MTHPITPPPELVEQLASTSARKYRDGGTHIDYERELVIQAARWGADQELEAVREYLCSMPGGEVMAEEIRVVRRPKPPTKEEALDELFLSFDRGYLKKESAELIRRALEALPDD